MPKLAIDPGYLYLLHGMIVLGCAYLIGALPPRAASAAHSRFVALLALGVLACFTFIVSEPPRLLEDFRTAYLRAGQAVLVGPAELISELQRGVDGFVNLPVVAYLFAPLAMLPGRGPDIAFTAIGLLSILISWYGLCLSFDLDRRNRLLLLLFFAACGPLHNSVKEGNTSHFVLLLLVTAVLSLKFNRKFLAGTLLGLASIIKLPLLLFGLYALLRRQWRMLAGGVSICTIAALSSLLIFGWSAHVTWYTDVLAPYSSGQILAFNVQSVRSFLGRMVFDPTVLTSWDVFELPSYIRALSTAAALALLVVAAAIVLLPFRNSAINAYQGRSAIEFSLVLLLACIVSPLSWSHYYCWLLVPTALFIAAPRQLAVEKATVRVGLVSAALTLPPILMPANSFVTESWYVRFGVSYLFLAACVMTAAIMLARVRIAWHKPVSVELDSTKRRSERQYA